VPKSTAPSPAQSSGRIDLSPALRSGPVAEGDRLLASVTGAAPLPFGGEGRASPERLVPNEVEGSRRGEEVTEKHSIAHVRIIRRVGSAHQQHETTKPEGSASGPCTGAIPRDPAGNDFSISATGSAALLRMVRDRRSHRSSTPPAPRAPPVRTSATGSSAPGVSRNRERRG
jgi:hypothetical protein